MDPPVIEHVWIDDTLEVLRQMYSVYIWAPSGSVPPRRRRTDHPNLEEGLSQRKRESLKKLKVPKCVVKEKCAVT